MNEKVRLLIVEDQKTDVELIFREVKKVIPQAEYQRVDSKNEFIEALALYRPHLIISDYSMPSFDGLTVIRLAREHPENIPVIICTGSIDEETAADTVKAGAIDYVIKENIIRIRQAVLNVIETKRLWQQRVEAEQKLKDSEERYRLISTVTSDYMFSTLVNPEGKLELNWVAGAFEKITGYTLKEYKEIGGWRACLHPEDIKTDQKDFQKLEKNRQVISEVRTVKKNGDVVWVRVYAHPLWDKKKKCLHGIYGAVQDVSERKRVEEEIRQLNLHLNLLVRERTKELELLNKTKDKFFSIIAHDLKGPVTAIIGSTELMIHSIQETPGDHDRLMKYSENILHSTQEGYKLLENLLDWSRSQTGAITNEPEELDLTELWDTTISSMKLNLSNKSIRISMSHKPWIVYADRNMVNTILRNLLSNAIKYSHSGGRITIKMRATGEFIRTEIMDEGVGMDKETLARLFRIDQKISTPGTMKERGTGLGLILCREFVEKCGGSIQAKSEEGKGSAFIFTLPVNREP